MKKIFPHDPFGETKVDWTDSVGFTALNSLYFGYQELFTFSLVDSVGIFSLV